jgi:hypothetical protein
VTAEAEVVEGGRIATWKGPVGFVKQWDQEEVLLRCMVLDIVHGCCEGLEITDVLITT